MESYTILFICSVIYDSFKNEDENKPSCDGTPMEIPADSKGDLKITYTYSIKFVVSSHFAWSGNTFQSVGNMDVYLPKGASDQLFMICLLLGNVVYLICCVYSADYNLINPFVLEK